MLWAGTEINLGVVTACLPSLRPIFLLITKGSAQPETKESRHLNNSSALKSKAVATFGSKGRNAKSYTGMDVDDEHRPFSIIRDDKNSGEGGQNDHTNVPLEEIQPPQDRVMVREDIYVNYSNV